MDDHPIWFCFDQFSFFPDKKEDYFNFIVRANAKCERYWELYFNLIFGSMTWEMVLSFISVLICWINHGYFDINYIFIPFKIV